MRSAAGQILVIDDDEGIREVLHSLLEDAGYHVRTAPNGAAALRLVERQPPLRLILLDMRMPVMDGWDFARRYHQVPGPHAPLIAMSASEEARRLATQIAADGFLGKPFEVDDVLAVVKRYAAPVQDEWPSALPAHRGDGTTRETPLDQG